MSVIFFYCCCACMIDFGFRTYVFTFDSLGTQHNKACKLLSQYIMAEAREKKGFDNPSEAKGKKAQVPVQPNYCDCGLYLLHFAKMFLSDPDKFKNLICAVSYILLRLHGIEETLTTFIFLVEGEPTSYSANDCLAWRSGCAHA